MFEEEILKNFKILSKNTHFNSRHLFQKCSVYFFNGYIGFKKKKKQNVYLGDIRLERHILSLLKSVGQISTSTTQPLESKDVSLPRYCFYSQRLSGIKVTFHKFSIVRHLVP